MSPPAPTLSLHSNATYVLAGSLGLGLDITNMMADHGAKHLVFLSKSGGSKNEKQLQRIRNRGVSADAYNSDITEAHSVASLFHQLKAQGFLIKGAVQCAMVLEV
ncbi:Beta-ketoacyl synthase [Metarhizium anisopliae]